MAAPASIDSNFLFARPFVLSAARVSLRQGLEEVLPANVIKADLPSALTPAHDACRAEALHSKAKADLSRHSIAKADDKWGSGCWRRSLGGMRR